MVSFFQFELNDCTCFTREEKIMLSEQLLILFEEELISFDVFSRRVSFLFPAILKAKKPKSPPRDEPWLQY